MIDVTALKTCTVQRRNGDFCGRDSIPRLPFPICAKHAIQIYSELTELIEANQDNDIVRIIMAMDELDRLDAKRGKVRVASVSPLIGTESVVYYLLVGDLVKIGYTQDINARLTAYPPNAHLLATERGGRALEKVRHSDFSEYLASGREWFTPGPRLRQHVEALDTYAAA